MEFGIFTKDTHADNYINPISHKHFIINSLAYRLSLKQYHFGNISQKDTIYIKCIYNPRAYEKFQKVFKDFNITLVPTDKCNIKNLINAN
jgi:hypothetical protein